MSPLRQRVHLLRRRLVAAAVALFVVLFGGITVQLASGHDPALSSTGTSTKAGVIQQSTPATSTSSTTNSAAATQSSPSTLAPVTTSQS